MPIDYDEQTENDNPSHRSSAPVASRPFMPGYGILEPHEGAGLLPWSWAVERLRRSQNYWLATTWPDGQPHVMPVWGVWLDEAFYFSTGSRSRKARNLEANPRCVICVEHPDEPVILEGVARKVTDPWLLKRVAEVYNQKYQWNIEPAQEGVRDAYGNEGPVFAVYPRVGFGFSEDLTGSATRWMFDVE